MVKIVEVSSEIYELRSLDEICKHIERCGRTCYKSEGLISEETAVPFIKGILKSGHESVIEHANVIFSLPRTQKNSSILTKKDILGLNITEEADPQNRQELIVVSGNMRAFRDIARRYGIHDFLLSIAQPLFYIDPEAKPSFEGLQIEGVQQSRFSDKHNYVTTHSICDIGAYKDITRHRPASFSIESTRYCNYSKGKFGCELSMMQPSNIEKETPLYEEWLRCVTSIEQVYMKMSDLGAKGDQLRMILPHSTKADMIMTTNVSEWKHIFSLRCHSAAHPSVQAVMKLVLENCHNIWPEFFKDQYEEFICKH
jgi:thymidylate synthase (FAD)